MNKPLTIAYLSGEDPKDKNAWSGSLNSIAQVLEEKGCVLEHLGPERPRLAWFMGAVINRLSLFFLHKRFDYRHSKMYAKAFGKRFSNKLKSMQFDVVLAVGGSEFVAYLKTEKPIVLVVDRTVAGAFEYHSVLTNLLVWSKKQSAITDAKAMRRTALNYFASTWAQRAAVIEYQLVENRNVVLPFGANVYKLPPKELLMHRTFDRSVCKLLFVGRDWENKGGDIALDCFKQLKSKGKVVELHIVGCSIPAGNQEEGLISHGFLDRNKMEDGEQLHQLYLRSHFFILPTRFEAYGLVFAEAAAYGLPAIGPDTGGVASAMCNGETGILMPANATGEDYANNILELWNDETKWKQQITKSRALYDANLSWERWATKFLDKLEQHLQANNWR